MEEIRVPGRYSDFQRQSPTDKRKGLYGKGAVVLGAAAVVLAACGSSSASQSTSTTAAKSVGATASTQGSAKLTTITLSTITAPSGDELPLFVANQLGIWKKYGLNVKVNYLSSEAQFTSLAKGADDLTIGSYAGMDASVKGAPITVVAYLGGQYQVIYASNNITSAQSFNNQNVKLGASAPGSISQTLPQAYLASQGISPSKYTTVYFAGNYLAAVTAFEKGDINALISAPPYAFEIAASGTGHILVRLDQNPQFSILSGLALSANSNWASTHSASIVSFLKAWHEATGLLNTSQGRQIAVNALVSGAKVSQAIADKWVSAQIPDLTVAPITSSQLSIIRSSLDSNTPAIKTAPASALIDNSYVTKAFPSS